MTFKPANQICYCMTVVACHRPVASREQNSFQIQSGVTSKQCRRRFHVALMSSDESSKQISVAAATVDDSQ